MVIQSSAESYGASVDSPRIDVGMLAPDFVLSQSDGRTASLADLRGHAAILAFYPPNWDPTRAEQLTHFNQLVSRIPGVNAELLGISTDGMWCQLAFANADVRVPLLADLDPHGAVAERYGVAGHQAVFVIGPDSVVRWRYVGAIGEGPQLERVLAALGTLSPAEHSFDLDSAAAGDNGKRSYMDEVLGLRVHDDVDSNEESAAHSAALLEDADSAEVSLGTTRRNFLATALAAGLALTVMPRVQRAQTFAGKFTPSARKDVAAIPVTLKVNGQTVALNLEPRVTLLDALREYAGLTGSKKGCDHGQCGACTVHVNGRRTLSCLAFAAMHQNDDVTTVEGLAKGDTLHPMQAAFIEHDGFQCGYCTPGQLMSATALLKEPCGTADSDVRECMSGNICRCGAYPGIVAAFQSARARG